MNLWAQTKPEASGSIWIAVVGVVGAIAVAALTSGTFSRYRVRGAERKAEGAIDAAGDAGTRATLATDMVRQQSRRAEEAAINSGALDHMRHALDTALAQVASMSESTSAFSTLQAELLTKAHADNARMADQVERVLSALDLANNKLDETSTALRECHADRDTLTAKVDELIALHQGGTEP